MSKIDGATQLTGLIGWPVEHSLSPAMHNAAFNALKLNWRYVPLPVRPDDLGAAVEGLWALGFRGVNVTVPHKQAVMPYLATLSEEARLMGAVNTLTRTEAGWRGDNTDALGFTADLLAHDIDVKGKLCLVLGAGGSARAVVRALVASGGQVAVFNRTRSRALDLTMELIEWFPGSVLSAHDLNALGDFVQDDDRDPYLIVNTTPLGMWPHTDKTPWPAHAKIPPGTVVYDLIYRPLHTRFLTEAKASGAHIVSGIGMLVRQGAASFTMWTGQAAPIRVMAQAAAEAKP